jgi:hypothetical protein
MNLLFVAIASFVAFFVVGMIAKVVIGRWMIKSSSPPASRSEKRAP